LPAMAVPRAPVCDQPLHCGGTDNQAFTDGAVDGASLRVKSLQSHEPVRISLTLTEPGVVFAPGPVVSGSVIVASDSSLGTVYQENVDYIVSPAEGRLLLKDGGSLSSGDSVTVWYLPYTVYEAGLDYTVQAALGQIRRLSGGGIADGETVLIDYTPVNGGTDDTIIESAVTAANRFIESEIDENADGGEIPALAQAATYLALEAVCRGTAARELTRNGGDSVARVWITLAENYAAQATGLLKAYKPPFAGPRGPVRA
ncbi:MAG: hypothetical protein KKA42_00720, partial [candidate division Zixibacteria bacterium]|nr:hypothetical protein [candidate division Zixibacteria bacterium]